MIICKSYKKILKKVIILTNKSNKESGVYLASLRSVPRLPSSLPPLHSNNLTPNVSRAKVEKSYPGHTVGA